MILRALLVVTVLAVSACSGNDDTEVVAEEDAPEVGASTIELTPGGVPSEDELARTAEVIRRRLAALGIDNASVDTSDGVVEIEIPDADDPTSIADILADRAELTFQPVLSSTPGEVAGGCTGEQVPQFDGPGDEPTACHDLGPADVDGSSVKEAEALLDGIGNWSVGLTLREGDEGIDTFNELASACFDRVESCPTGQVAIVLDDVVASAPTVNEPTFERDAITISGGFSESDAKSLAIVLQTGALPIELEVTDVEEPG